MTAKHFRWLFLALLSFFVFVVFFTKPMTIGASAEWSNNSYHFAAGAQPWALGVALIAISLYVWLMYSPPIHVGNPLPGVLRRFLAFWLDFVLAMLAVGPSFGLLPVLIEWRRTGVFEWAFERTSPAPGDKLLLTIGFLWCSVFMVAYYAIPLVRRKPSPGTCILGYQIVADNDLAVPLQTAVLRTVLGFIALCVAYLAPLVARDRKNGKFWLDRVFGTRALLLG